GITVGSSVTANVSCNGGNNGAIEVTITGGTPNYNVNWGAGSASTATSPYSITGLTANTYNITVTDANSCQGVTTATITQPTLLTASSSATTINCNGGNSTVTVTAAGGTAPYTGTGTFTVTAGTHNYVVTDNNGCSANTSVTVSEPTLLTASASATPILCNGGNSTVTVTAAGGTAPYTGTGTFSVTAGTYNYVVTDNNGCSANTSVTISQPTQLTASVTALVNQNCTMNGSATVTAAGGTAPYTYTWPAGAGGVSGGSASSLTAGTYNVTVADNNGCSLVQPVTIITIGGITVSAVTTSNVNCFGGNNGAIQVTTTGGTANYTVNWGTGSINTPNAVYTINGLTGGSYTITVTDGNGCSNTTTTSISTPAAPLTSSATATAIACFGGNSTVTVTASGGTAPYTGTGTFSVTAGAYNYTITDNNGCTSIASVSISQPSQLAASATATSILCNGNNATVTVTATGGTLPYSGTGTFTVPAGSYSYTVTDFNGCTANTSVTISQPTALVPSIVSITHPICTNLGSATVAATGGTPNYTFTWPVSAGGVVGPTANNLAGGSYIVTVTDQNSCTATITVTLVDAGNVSANLISSTNPQCYGMATGSITIGIAGGTPAYTVNWGTGSASTATSPYTISSLIAGTYSITVTDFNGCQDIITNIAITQPPQLIANLGVITNVSCNGQADGTANIIVSGGTPAYTYTWNPAWVSGPNPTNLTQGNYAVTVSDMNSCSLALNFSINEPTALTVMHTVTNAPCFGGVGTASVTVAGGGIAPYTIMWDDGGTSFNHNSVPVNINFGYTVTDNNGCEFISFVNVTQPNQLAASIAGSNAICNGTSTGSATVTVSGGTMPYFYAWSNGGVNSTIGYLSAGSYSVTVTDYNGCTTTQSVDITEPAVVAVNIATNPVVCGTNLGSATASASGGTPPYNYQWNNGTNGPTATNLTAGTYYCTVVDQNTCYVISSINISVTDSITASITEMQSIGCNGESTGTLMAATTSTNMPISYLWSNGVTSQTNSYLSAGAYYVTVSDGWGCSGTQNFNLTEPSLLTATPNISNVGCYGGNNGSISLAVSGGSPAYTCLWSNSATSFNMINLTAGDYAVVVTDNNGCIFTGTYTVSQPAAPLAVVSLVDHISCFGDNDGSLLMNATGGTPPYVFTTTMGTFLSNGNEIHDLLPGTYHIQVIDNNGCQAETNAAVMEPAPMSATYVRTNPSCLGNFDGSIFVNVIGGTAPFWYMANEFSSQTALIDSLRQGIYNIQIIDYNGCEYSFGPVQLIDQNEDCLKIPNAFTPNDDGINDTWIIENLWLFPGAVVQVFNRWGQILYDSGINEGDWDGTYNGKIMPTGSYIYVIRLYAEGDQYSGVVTIVH
ncbi:MAG TPA: gliding motility-associated C-terminal domain-containing protein, partial [Bacteroidales bacterium]|nr:gliding motility-associated C-terminal domain-containing protein [Bacteroidales bacterium]